MLVSPLFSLKVLSFYIRTKDLLINLALLPLSMSKQVFIVAILALNTKCLLLIFGTLSRTAHVETLNFLIAQTLLSIKFFNFCLLLQF